MKNQNKILTNNLSEKSAAIIDMLADRGLVDDKNIKDDKIQKAVKGKKRRMFHNTQLMLKHYRDMTWILECFPANIADELDTPMHDLDALISAVSEELDLDNRRLENRLKSIGKSRMLLDRFNYALTILEQKPGNGKQMYNLIYETYINPDPEVIKLKHHQLIYRLDISSRHYYRLREEAVNILSLRLWAAPASEFDSWLDVLTILENI
jgi:hypothetical protein